MTSMRVQCTPHPSLLAALRSRSSLWVSFAFLLLALGLNGGVRTIWLSSPVFAQGQWSLVPANELFKPSVRESVVGTKRRVQNKGTPLDHEADAPPYSAPALQSHWPAITSTRDTSYYPSVAFCFPLLRSLRAEPRNPRAPPLAN